jgi:hypothetical protein
MSEGVISKRLAAIMSDASAIGKDSYNKMQGFNFRGIDAVMNHLHPIFAKHGVIILPTVLDEKTEERVTKNGGNLIYRILKIRFEFVADDGSSVACIVLGEGMDSGDKASNKAMAVALKYALTQMLLLPYDEVDPDAETHEVKPKPTPSEPKPAPMPEPRAEPEMDNGGAITKEIVVGKVLVKEDTGANGKPYTKFSTKADDGEWYSTFDTELGDKLQNLAGDNAIVTYELVKGKYRTITQILPLADPARDEEAVGEDKQKEKKEDDNLPF